MSDLAIGIDLGTTNSCVAIIYKNKSVEILENRDGGRVTPSFIYFTDNGETVVGEHAKRMATDGKPDCGIYEIKRLVGRQFSDSYLRHNLTYLPFHVTADSSDEPLVKIKQGNKIIEKTPQQLCTIILQKLKKDVETRIGKVVSKVVITVPAYFNVRQREVTLAAARIAGFTVLQLLNEPTAAALFYYFDHKGDKKSYSLVYDLGGGTFDVAVLKKSSSNIEIIGVDGDTQLGGHDFDNLIMNYVCEFIKRKYNRDLRTNKVNLRRLHNKCEEAKKALSTVHETVITLMAFLDDHPVIVVPLTRNKFEEICEPVFQRTVGIIDSCLKCCGIPKHLIKDVILSGGSIRIPKIQEMISEYFNGKSLNMSINPDECVAKGAALQAAMLSKNPKQAVRSKISLKDVVPLSLGVEIFAGEMSFLIKRNTVIPTDGSRSYYTIEENQPMMHFSIYEGERKEAAKNRLIGNLTISDLTPGPAGKNKVTLSMNVDNNGILTITAKEKLNNNVKELRTNYARGDKSESEIKDFQNSPENEEENRRFDEFIKYKKYLIKYCTAVIQNLEKKKLEHSYNDIYELCMNFKKEGEESDLDNDDGRVEKLVRLLKLKCEPLASYYKFSKMPKLK